MLTTGHQLKAARALVGVEQADLAERSGVAVTTIRKMEWKGAETLTSGLDTIKRVQTSLEAAGVEFLNHGQPGVRLAKRTDGPRASPAHVEAQAVEARSQAASAADDAMTGMDATKQEKAERRGALTGEPAMVEKARDKGRARK
ncbi:helix-turn-helix domain-containing protein [Bosea vestrisii]|uniref:helix-turn-helix domain-containing protein n=1 Tax=Bosea vestrisii TaxID=151416 RepID=UPI003262FABF